MARHFHPLAYINTHAPQSGSSGSPAPNGAPNRHENSQKHGGNIDPFAISFDSPDGVPVSEAWPDSELMN
jgi:hypothetical protein